MIYQSTKENLLIRYLNLIRQINIDKENSNIINSSKSISALNEMSITLPKIDILNDNITIIIDTQYWTKISKMQRNSIKIISKWKNISKFIKKSIDIWIQR